MHEDPAFWRDKARHFRAIAEDTESEVLATALRSRAAELDALASRIEAGGSGTSRRSAPAMTGSDIG